MSMNQDPQQEQNQVPPYGGQPNPYGYDQRQYGAGPSYNRNPYGQNPYAQNPYGQNPCPQGPYAQQNAYGQNPYGQNPYGQNSYGQNPYTGNPYVSNPYIQGSYTQPKPRKKNPYAWKVWTAIICCVALVISTLAGIQLADRYLKDENAGSNFSVIQEQNSSDQASGGETSGYASISDLAADVKGCVVSLLVKSSSYYFSSGQTPGTGIIIGEDDSRIYLATNATLISGADKVSVYFGDDTTTAYEASLRASDEETDLSVIYVDKSVLPEEVLSSVKIASFGDSDTCRIGDLAVAIGCPYSLNFENSVTVGTITGLERTVTFTDPATHIATQMVFLQTDATINDGNSGGPLFNGKGEVVGIVNHKINDTAVEGMGFATPSNIAAPVLNELVTKGKVVRPYLGITGLNVVNYQNYATQYSLTSGVLVTTVDSGSGAEKGGVKAGDVIIQCNDKEIVTFDDLSGEIKAHAPGDTMTLSVLRGYESGKSETVTLTVTLGEK